MPENPTPSGLLQPDAANNGNAGAGAIDALSLFRRLSSATVATSFQPSQRDQFGGQIYNRSNTNLANLATQLGYSAIGSGNRSTAVGSFAYAREDSAVALGVYALALGPSSVAIGDQALSSGYRSITIGNQGQGNALGAISIGFQARALGVNSIAIGSQAYAIGANAISIGASARTVAAYSIALGALASVPVSNSPGALAIGANANVTGAFGAAIALGAGATVLGTLSPAIAIGSNATVTSPGREGIAIGTNALVSARGAQAYGEATTASFTDSVAFGRATITTSTNQMMIGNPTYPLSMNISGPTPWVDVIAYGATGDGSTDDFARISAAISASIGDVYFPSGTYRLASNLTITSSIRLHMATGAKFNIDSGKSISVSGGIEAGLTTIFTGNGSVSFAPGGTMGRLYNVPVEWFGALGDGSTDDSTAINAALASVTGAEGTVTFREAQYRIGSSLSCGSIRIQGVGIGSNLVTTAALGASNVLSINGSDRDGLSLRDFQINCNAAGASAIVIGSAHLWRIDNLIVQGGTDAAFKFTNAFSGVFINCAASGSARGFEVSRVGSADGTGGISVIRFNSSDITGIGAIVDSSAAVDLIGCELQTVGNGPALWIRGNSTPIDQIATNISGGWFGSNDIGIQIGGNSGGFVYGVSISGAGFYVHTSPAVGNKGIYIINDTAFPAKGVDIRGCSFEDLTNAIYTSGVITSTNRITIGANGYKNITNPINSAGTVYASNALVTGSASFIGDIRLETAGSGILVKRGSNATFGIVTLSGAGTAILYSTKVTTTGAIFLAAMNASGTAGAVYISTSANLVSATVASTNAADTRDVHWWIVNPA